MRNKGLARYVQKPLDKLYRYIMKSDNVSTRAMLAGTLVILLFISLPILMLLSLIDIMRED